MALETDGRGTEPANVGRVDRLRQMGRVFQVWLRDLLRQGPLWAERVVRLCSPVALSLERIWDALGRMSLVRFISSSLLRRIVISNLLGLAVMFLGVLYLSQFNIWMIDSKRENLQIRGGIIAGAIASNASLKEARVRSPDEPLSKNENPFAELEFSLGPVQITQMLRRLLHGTTNRARVYDLKGNLIHDSSRVLPPGGLASADEKGRILHRPKTKNLWTKITQYLLSSDLRVYKELGDVNGQLYPEVRVALKGKTEGLLLLTKSGERIVSVASPIVRGGAVQGALLLSTRPGEIDDAVAEQQIVILALAVLALAAAMIASYLLARTVAGPMRQLSEVAEDVTQNIRAAGNIPQLDDREDEVGQLTRAFKTMTASLYLRIEASENFAADVAHELKNPLTAARSTAEAFDYAKTDEQRAMLVNQIQEELKRLNRLITDVSNASRLEAELALQQMEPVGLAEVADGVVTTFQDLMSGSDKTITLKLDAAAKASGAYVVSGHSGRLAQILTNLVDNALSFSPPDGTVTVHLRRAEQNVIMSVEDEGPGIDEEALEKIFSRFYTYRPTANSSRGNNSGLGLSISREIVRAHKGQIWAENRAPRADDNDGARRGARFVVSISASDAVSTNRLRRTRRVRR